MNFRRRMKAKRKAERKHMDREPTSLSIEVTRPSAQGKKLNPLMSWRGGSLQQRGSRFSFWSSISNPVNFAHLNPYPSPVKNQTTTTQPAQTGKKKKKTSLKRNILDSNCKLYTLCIHLLSNMLANPLI